MWTPDDDRLYCVDRIEEGLYVLTDANGHETATKCLPLQTQPGDSFRFINGTWVQCQEETAARRRRIDLLLNKLIKKK